MSRRSRAALVGCVGLTAALSVGWALASVARERADAASGPASPSRDPFVRIIAPEPPGDPYEPESKSADPNDPACQTGCSLAKHAIPPFTLGDFREATIAYADHPPDAASEPLEKLLFYGVETRQYLADYGPGDLPASHVAALERELRITHAIVSIRLVDDAGRVRVAYGPQRVPLGVKQHLRPVLHDLQPLEFNGTVMRTGVRYLWSRY